VSVLGIGVDAVEIDRVRRARERQARFLQRICTQAEAGHCREDPGGSRLAGRFAAKEAVGKAIGVPLSWHDVEVLPGPGGRPQVKLCGRAKRIVGGGKMLLSITHSRTIAVAAAVWVSE
jgi:holo-[acyl-carrier protein] synthase